MPIVEIEVVVGERDNWSSNIPARLADELAVIFKSQPNSTWVKVRRISAEDYAENDRDGSRKSLPEPESFVKTDAIDSRVFPVFVSVTKRNEDSFEIRRKEARRIAEVVSFLLDRPPENTHIIYQPPASGRIAFGGNLLE